MNRPLPVATTAQARRYARDLIRLHPGMFRAVIGLHVAAALAGLAGPRLLGDLVQGVHDHAPMSELDQTAVAIAAFVVAQALLIRSAHLASARLGERVLHRLRTEFVSRVLALPLSRVESAGPGDLLTRATRDVDALAQCVRFAVPETLIALITLGLVVGALVLVSPLFAVPLLVGVPFMVAGTRWYLRRAPGGYLRQNAAWAEVTEGLAETVQSARTVEALGRGHQRIRRTDIALRHSWRAERYTLRLRTVWWPLIETGYVLPMVLTLLAGGWLYLHGRITLGALTAAVIYVQQLVDPLDRLVGWLDELEIGAAALARLLGVAAGPSPVPAGTPETGSNRIEVRGVRFGYEPGREVLHGVDLVLEPGERLAVVGVSGAGKSTLGRLLAGVHRPSEGSVTVGGVPLTELSPERLRAEVALVTQEHHVFIGTLRDNVALVRPAAPEGEIRAALTAVQALNWVDELPDGLDTVVGAGGRPLSPEQAQQVALARLVIADPHTLVLDEATAMLDPRAARDLERSLAAVVSGRTVVAIAHRLFSAHDADRVAVVENGRIVELGAHDDLVAAGGVYATLWRSWQGETREGAPGGRALS
ncbi:ABC transporter ATP-binding protein [Actinoplanes derwentensis]|uniref:ABC-type multidrug transport system, ATPase and permease component n=1 Tax=Actinoplanes derwentensis TaxID=113562 RepID=A0A1H2CKQ6_9ACTN|nr:ABC transporter ATP-binding protein [Actinoplanes derwentensis]GID82691.1 multidrug ABC transporter ATP-binding protein [Actinoplanes derwentensis]SDT71021.1 ABC-type multidrug transport system, ATPase and permease component [Actinoplanes derwentensis]